MASNSADLVKFSQENLYFPLPINSTIENIVQIKNLLPSTDKRSDNVIAFKVLSGVRNRYAVRPRTGFIFPAESTRVRFLFDLPLVQEQIQKGTAVMPDAKTKDTVFVDVAVVPAEELTSVLAQPAPTREALVEAAAAFWKGRGQIHDGEAAGRRYQLRCLYETPGEVPPSLVMRMASEKATSAAKSQTPNTSKSRARADEQEERRTAPPSMTPSPARGGESNAQSNKQTHTQSNTQTNTQSNTPASRPAVAYTGESSVAQKKGPLWKEILFYPVPHKVAAVLLVLALLCALFERDTILSKLLIGQ